MKYLITGAGMLGSALAERMRAGGHDVVLADNATRDGVVAMDLRDPAAIEALLDGVDGVFHTAAIHGMRDAPRADFFDVNVRGTWNLCEAASGAGITRFVHSSTIGVYGDAPRLVLDADTAWQPAISPYNVSKQLAEHVVRWYADTTGMHAVALRYGGFRQTLEARFGELPEAWARSGAIVDLGDVVRANVLAMAALPLPRFGYIIAPSGGNSDSPYTIDSTAAERDLGLTFSAPTSPPPGA